MAYLLLAFFFGRLIYRELTSHKFSTIGMDGMDITLHAFYLLAAVWFTWWPIHYWMFEYRLNQVAHQLADNRPTRVYCDGPFDAATDYLATNVAGHANPETGEIFILYPWCGLLMDYLKHPATASDDEVYSLALFTHESMHARGELVEPRTECQAVQRHLRASKLLGIPDDLARKNALRYYETLYWQRHGYFSSECAPGKSLDEHLPDSTWPAEKPVFLR